MTFHPNTLCASVAIRVLGKRGHGSGADPVPEDRWQKMAVLQRRSGWSEVLRASRAPWTKPFKKACGSHHNNHRCRWRRRRRRDSCCYHQLTCYCCVFVGKWVVGWDPFCSFWVIPFHWSAPAQPKVKQPLKLLLYFLSGSNEIWIILNELTQQTKFDMSVALNEAIKFSLVLLITWETWDLIITEIYIMGPVVSFVVLVVQYRWNFYLNSYSWQRHG